MRDAIFTAVTLDIFHRHSDRVKMANISMMINVMQSLILTDHEKLLVTPTYWVFDLYQPFQGATPYAVTVAGARYRHGYDDLPVVDASAAKGKDGKVYLAIVNLDPNRAANVVTNLSGEARGRVLTGPQMDSHNTFESPDAVRPIPFSCEEDKQGRVGFELPAKSVAVLAVE